MFAEELGGNATKRRQEEAKARRRKLKQQEEQKKQAQERAQQQKAAANAAATNGSASATSTAPETSSAAVTAAPTLLEIPASSDGTKNAAVANALQQRQQRQAAQHQHKAALTIQSFYRAHRSNVVLLEQQSVLLGQRLKDLNTLTTLLKQQAGNRPYVPPPATATALCLSMLFLTRSLPYSSQRKRTVKLRNKMEDSQKVKQLIQLILLPGIYCTDENGNPFLVWLQSKLGQWRIEALIRLALVTATSSNVDEAVVVSCLEFLRAIAGTSGESSSNQVVQASIVAFGLSRLWSPSPPSNQIPTPTHSKSFQTSPVALFGSSLDWIAVLRFHLMYATGGPDPIPKAAERVRESSIPTKDKNQADQIFRTVLQGIRQQPSGSTTGTALQLRFVSEILTVPLLTWKILDASIQVLLSPVGSDYTKKSLLIVLLETYLQCHAEHLNAGEIGLTLCNDTTLTKCPATPTQTLLANILQIGRMSPALNGTQPSKLDFAAATTFYQFVGTLVDAVPLATFTSRESVVEWISDGKGHHSPVVLSSIVMEQCKYLLVDGFVRKLFDCAIDDTALRTESILKQKTEKDLKQETALQQAGANAASLAAKEARVDRSKGFWNSAGWARRIKGGVSKLLTTNASGETDLNKGNGKLIDASSVSRQLAQGEGTPNGNVSSTASSPGKNIRVAYTSALLKVLCRVYGIVLARWGGGGGESCIRSSGPLLRKDTTKGSKQEIATTKPDPCTQALLNNLVFSSNIIKASWGLIQSDPQVVVDVYCIIDPGKGRAPIRSFSIHPCYGTSKGNQYQANSDGAALLFLFVSALSHILIVTDDTEIHEMGKPLPLHQMRRCIQTLKQLLYRACCLDDSSLSSEDEASAQSTKYETNYFGLALISASARTMRDLYDRSSRRPLAIPKLWLIDDLMETEIRRCKNKDDYVRLLSAPVLRVCPFLVSFKRRLKLFERIVTTDRVAIQGENSQNPFHTNPLKPGIPIRITRGRILEDGLSTMNHLGRNMRQRLSVQYFNEAGTRESGIDAGGLFKEFWTDLCAIAFDPNYALFRLTEGTTYNLCCDKSSAAYG